MSESACADLRFVQLIPYYVKRLGENDLWYDGLHLEDFEKQIISENLEEPHFSDFKYHTVERPYENADVVFYRKEAYEP